MTPRAIPKAATVVIAGLILGVVAFGFGPTLWENYRYKPRIDPLTDFRIALGEGIRRVDLNATCQCKAQWAVSFNADQLSRFLADGRVADTVAISGHSYPIYEASVTVWTKSQERKYNLSVNVHEPSDAFLRRVVVAPDGSGQPHEWIYREFRLPRSGTWLQAAAPQGAL